jgi:hypothetical protein
LCPKARPAHRGGAFGSLLPKITLAIPEGQRVHAESATSLVIVTRRARDVIRNQATIGHPDFGDPVKPLRVARDNLKLARARLGWHRSQPGPQTVKLELLINLKTAKALGLTIPPSVIGRADQVIE